MNHLTKPGARLSPLSLLFTYCLFLFAMALFNKHIKHNKNKDQQVSELVELWKQLKPDVFIHNTPIPADQLQWKYARVDAHTIRATVSWKYSVLEDPWSTLGTTLHQFDLFMETMQLLFRDHVPDLTALRYEFAAHMGTARLCQTYMLKRKEIQ